MMLNQTMTEAENRVKEPFKLLGEESRRHLASTIALRDYAQEWVNTLNRQIEEIQSLLGSNLPYAKTPPAEAADDYCTNHPGKIHKTQLRNKLQELGCCPESTGEQRLQAISLGIRHAVTKGLLKDEKKQYVWKSKAKTEPIG
jgi:hypothetical protein